MSYQGMIVECLLKRPGGTHIEIDGQEYSFLPNQFGEHVTVVANPEHLARLASITEAYRLKPEATVPGESRGIIEAVEAFEQEPDTASAPDPDPDPAPAPAPAPAEPPVVPAPEAPPAPPEPQAPPPAETEKPLDELTREELEAVFEAELGRKPNHNAKDKTLINHIQEARDGAKDGGGE